MLKISLITPTYNSEKTIARNIHSIISQSYSNFEHIIVDNMSSDATLSIVKKLYSESGKFDTLKIISEKDNGIADAFNKGIKNSSGDIIAILNSDDWYYNENVLQKVVEAFSNPNVLFVHGDIFFEDFVYGSNRRKPLLCSIEKAMPYNHPTMFFRKTVYQGFGTYDVNFRYAMDYELFCRIFKKSPNFAEKGFYLQEFPLVYMSGSGASGKYEKETLKEVKKALSINSLWNFQAQYFFLLRFFRVQMKIVFTILHLHSLIKIWRKWKWR